jgi:hypothetical protein
VVFDKVYYYLVDGVHRYEATKSAGAGEIDANVADGSSRDALLASVGANSRHGPRRSNEDKLVVQIRVADPGSPAISVETVRNKQPNSLANQWLTRSNGLTNPVCGRHHHDSGGNSKRSLYLLEAENDVDEARRT